MARVGDQHNLKNHKRHLRRLRWASKGISDTDALTAFFTFTNQDNDVDLELTIGRLLVILDRNDLLG
jgi:hypothetical protein